MEHLKIVRQVKKLIENGWCQGTYNTDSTGKALSTIDDPTSCNYCLSGALIRATPLSDGEFMAYTQSSKNDPGYKLRSDILDIMLYFISGHTSAVGFNDYPTTTKEDILNLLRVVEKFYEERENE